MKSLIPLFILLCVIGWTCHAQKQPEIAVVKPDSGYVSDADAARGIAKAVVIALWPQTHGDGSYVASIKHGVWTVRFFKVQLTQDELTPPVVIEIRQTSGAIIKYENPRA